MIFKILRLKQENLFASVLRLFVQGIGFRCNAGIPHLGFPIFLRDFLNGNCNAGRGTSQSVHETLCDLFCAEFFLFFRSSGIAFDFYMWHIRNLLVFETGCHICNVDVARHFMREYHSINRSILQMVGMKTACKGQNLSREAVKNGKRHYKTGDRGAFARS